jgi:hypothetical protein
MLTQEQNTIVYLMFLNGVLFLSLNSIAWSIISPGGQKSKRRGYALILGAMSAICAQQEYRGLMAIGLTPDMTIKLLLGGFIVPVFLFSFVYYRSRKTADPKPSP